MNSASVPTETHLSAIQTLDKLDKKPQQEVIDELSQKDLTDEQINKLFDELDKAQISPQLETVLKTASFLGVSKDDIKFLPHLARGLDYYTGTIFELVIDGYTGGSVAGGGRYDNLIQALSGINVPAVGISFGFDRIIEAMDQFNLFPSKGKSVKVLVTIFAKDFAPMSAFVASHLRTNGIATELFPDDSTKLDKQLKYANKKEFSWVVIIGPNEVKNDEVVIKNLNSGTQESVKLKELVSKIKS
jgi:histidyl-tRNA synthetase